MAKKKDRQKKHHTEAPAPPPGRGRRPELAPPRR